MASLELRGLTKVYEAEELILIRSDPVLAKQDLETSRSVLDVDEGSLSHLPACNDPAGNVDGPAGVLLRPFGQAVDDGDRLGRRVRARHARRIRIDAACAEFVDLPGTLCHQFVHWRSPGRAEALVDLEDFHLDDATRNAHVELIADAAAE